MKNKIGIFALILLFFSINSAFATNIPLPLPGQTTTLLSLPTAQAAPNQICASAFQSSHAASAYGANQLINLNSTAASNVAEVYTAGTTNGLPLTVTSGKLIVSTSNAFTTPASATGGYFWLHLYGQASAQTNGDGGAYTSPNVNYCGTLACTLQAHPLGTDYAEAICTPLSGMVIDCVPAGGSSSIYGYLETQMTTWSPSTTTYNYQTCVNFQ